jgi:hypothetical protein
MYGAIDLLVIGKYASSADVPAVSTGSQIMTTFAQTEFSSNSPIAPAVGKSISLQILSFIYYITFIIIAMIYTFHINFSIVNFICQSLLQNIFYFNISDWASFHCQKIVLLIYKTPINNFVQLFLQN